MPCGNTAWMFTPTNFTARHDTATAAKTVHPAYFIAAKGDIDRFALLNSRPPSAIEYRAGHSDFCSNGGK
jgi:hypothetical protein